ncbi:MAG TPA: M23 family metallopeptidase, partial [Dissulfurispiraceae bacterium]|nr:M23 family metallopeptidase [Dissulfurispiraceae bacterium]
MALRKTLLAFALAAFLLPGAAEPFEVSISPSRIKPGDAFVITVTEAHSCSLPVAALDNRELPFGRCGEGCFIAIGALDIESSPGSYAIGVKMGTEERSVRLAMEPVRFPEEAITLQREKVFLSEQDRARVHEEALRLNALWDTVTERAWTGRFTIPLGNSLSTPFGTKRTMNGSKVSVHKGVDIRGNEGEKVLASNAGRVALAEELFYGGNTVVLDHGQGVFTIYMHLSAFTVKEGEEVAKGRVIGRVGSTGRSSGPHLHFGVKVSGISVNPLSFTKLKL